MPFKCVKSPAGVKEEEAVQQMKIQSSSCDKRRRPTNLTDFMDGLINMLKAHATKKLCSAKHPLDGGGK